MTRAIMWMGKNQFSNSQVFAVLAHFGLTSHFVRLAGLRSGLRAELQASPLLDHAGQSARFGAALRGCWAEACVEALAPAVA